LRLDHLVLNQLRLSQKIRLEKIGKRIDYIAGADVAVTPHNLIGCIGVFTYPSLELVEHTYAVSIISMPYIPGFLSFREIPVIVKCYKKLKKKPDLILVDGQGIAHPRALGLASHLGVILKCPTIGCAKSHFYGDYEIPSGKKGSYYPIREGQKKIGLVLRTRDNVNPLFVSPGHLVDFEDCKHYVLSSLTKYRIPEPLRFAHRTAGERARQHG